MKKILILAAVAVPLVTSAGCNRGWDSWFRRGQCSTSCDVCPDGGYLDGGIVDGGIMDGGIIGDGGMIYEGPIYSGPSSTTVLPEPATSADD